MSNDHKARIRSQSPQYNKILFALLVALVIFPPLLVLPISADSVHIKTTFSQLIILLLLVSWGFAAVSDNRFGWNLKNLDSLSYAILLFLVLAVLSFLISRYKYASFEELLRYASYVGLYFLIRKHIRTERQVDLLIAAIAFTTAIVSVYGLFQRAGYDFIPWNITTGQILSMLGHPNFFAGYLVLVIPLLMTAFLAYPSWIKRTLLAATLVMATLCLLFTYSRGAFLGILPALIVLGLLLLFHLTAYLLKNKHRLIALALLMLIPLTVTVALDKQLVERASSAVELETDVTVSNQVRLVIWRGTLAMFQAKPIFGWGLGTFQIYFPQFRASDYSRKGVSHNTQHAHSEYLEVAAELGIIGLGVFLSVIVLYFARVHRALRTLEEAKPKLLLIGSSSGILANLLHNLVSVNLRWTVPAVTFWFVFGLTMVLADWPSLKHPPVSQRYQTLDKEQRSSLFIEEFYSGFANKLTKTTLYFLLCLITLLLSAMILTSFISDLYSGLAQIHLQRGKEAMAAHRAKQACYWNPYNLKAYYTLAYAYSRQGYVEDAVRIYQRLGELAPDYAQIHHNLASAYAILGQMDLAIEEARKAVAFEDAPTTHALLADILTKQEAWEQSEKEFQRALELDADFVYAWGKLGDLYLVTERYEKAIESYQKVLELNEGNVGVLFGIAQCYEEMGQWEDAQEYYEQVVDDYPNSSLAAKAKERLAHPE